MVDSRAGEGKAQDDSEQLVEPENKGVLTTHKKGTNVQGPQLTETRTIRAKE